MTLPVAGWLLFPLFSAALALLAGLVLRQRLSFFSCFGVAWLGNIVATLARSLLRVDPWQKIGIADPLLWIFGGCFVVLASARVIGFLRGRLSGLRRLERARSPPVETGPGR